MPSIKLSRDFIKNIKTQSKIVDYADSEVKGLVLRVKTSGNMVWRLNYRNEYKIQKRFTIGQYESLTLTQARLEARRLNGLIAQGVDIQEEKKGSRNKEISYIEYLNEFYFDWFKNSHKSWQKNNKWLATTFKPLHNKSLSYVNSKDNISKFLHQLKNKNNWSNATYNRVLAMVKGSVSRAVEFGYLEENRLSGLKSLPVNSGKIRYLSEDETQRFFDALNKQSDLIRNIILVAYYTGMRKGEIFSLRWGNIDFVTDQINLEAINTKTNTSRQIPIHKKLKPIFKANEGSNSDLVFKNSEGEQLTQIEKQWKKFKKEADIENFRFHDLRHNFCSMLVMKGVPIYTVAQLAGHSDVKTTQIYAHLSPDIKRAAVDLL